MSKKIQKRNAEASKALIITHAITLFSEKGYAFASMDALAKRSGLNKAMVFYYFKNKKGLYAAVMHKILIQIQSAVLEENKQHSAPREELEGFVRTYARFACKHPYLPSLLLRELSDNGAIVPEVLFTSMKQLFVLFSSILKKGEDRGCFVHTAPMILYFMVLGTLNLMITTKTLRIQAHQEDSEIDTFASGNIDEIVDYIVEEMLRMLVVPNKGDNQ